MISFDGMKAEEQKKGFEQLPAGAYVGRILSAEVTGNVPQQTLVLNMDVTEGPFESYYTKRYEHDKGNGRYEARFKGVLKLRVPNPDDKRSQYPETDKRRFNDALWRIQQSNPGYEFHGDENTLKGKAVGFSVQDDEYNGNAFTRIARLEVVEHVRKGMIEKMPPRQRRGDAYDTPRPAAPMVDQQTGFTAVETDELPF